LYCEIAAGGSAASISNDLEGDPPGTVARTIRVSHCLLSGVDNTGDDASHLGLGDEITNELDEHANAFTPLP
jgi:hypothetical protein